MIGSRTKDKAQTAVAALIEIVPDANVTGGTNLEAARTADIVILTVPFAHQRSTLEDIRTGIAGKIVVDTTVPLVPPKVARVQLPEEDSAAVRAQAIVGEDALVVSAFHNVAADLMDSDADMECDVLVAGDKLAAREVVVELAEKAGFTAWHAGPLANSAAMEALTSVLIFMNKRYRFPGAGIKISGGRAA